MKAFLLACIVFVLAVTSAIANTIDVNGKPLKWDSTIITYALLTKNYEIPPGKVVISQNNCRFMHSFAEINKVSPSLPLETIKTQLKSAFTAWEQVANITFQEVEDPDIANIVLGAEGESNNRAFTNIGYLVNEITKSYVCLNPSQQWKVGFNGNIQVYDLRHVFMHEIGHAIGLDHPSNPSGSIMSFRYDEKVRELQPDDIEAIQNLYGPSHMMFVDIYAAK